ncbi:RNA polymerase sigma-70 factor (sigma-E family) [Kitasatospora sp. SolWspMP-SS2h]|uniref:SigE family RNA polymerase sigma factor n=1 Tax=Kitasatospora sp. SolWspMP-SS2h TaxID=1305729 RepID=UPI000DBA232C|nr:SigE family RNA polymerase sigma factor [Kitasatospora sp. SolWspMP-SS2h]RAJ38365.1 RNA polymerase sigma-70 factor (sigma-E family) [Kitasatospora sp. SolWspMP-SS2h]
MEQGLEFERFASSRAHRLFQVAYLMCGDWHQAQDLVQTTLAKMFSVWGRLRRGADDGPTIDAYARKVLLRTYLSQKRLRKSSEIVTADLPEQASAPSDGGELRLVMVAALNKLPPRNRAVVVLRYLEDHSIEAVADMLGTSPGAVKSLNFRSLAKLREILGEDHEALFHS